MADVETRKTIKEAWGSAGVAGSEEDLKLVLRLITGEGQFFFYFLLFCCIA